MRISRIYVEFPLVAEREYPLPAETIHYLTRVLRLKSGAKLILFDGQGDEYPATLHINGKHDVQVCTAAAQRVRRESPLKLSLVLAVSRGERMDFSVQKAVELGARRIVPLLSEFGVVRLSGERARRRLSHWQKIAVHASEQCGRTRVVKILPLISLSEYIQTPADGYQRLVLDPSGKKLSAFQSAPVAAELLIGPEGGLSQRESDDLQAGGWTSVSLGPRILRAETAVVAGLTAMQLLYGDLGRED